MEFYFGDANLNKDRFMTKLVAESETGSKYLDFSLNIVDYTFPFCCLISDV
jgi:hypothetical protein